MKEETGPSSLLDRCKAGDQPGGGHAQEALFFLVLNTRSRRLR
jgi:hypothetical protein